MPSRRAAILRAGVILVVLFVVFGLILPQFVDYREVVDALAALTLPQIVVMTLLGLVGWFVSGLLFAVVIPGLSAAPRAWAYLILSGIGSSIPFGPWNMGIVWVVLRGWGIRRECDLRHRAVRHDQHARPVRAAADRGHRGRPTGGLSGERPWAAIIASSAS